MPTNPELSYNPLERRFSRRLFNGAVAKGAAVVGASALTGMEVTSPRPAEAQSAIVTVDYEKWGKPQNFKPWFPDDPRVAANLGLQPLSLALRKHDQILYNLKGTRGWSADEAWKNEQIELSKVDTPLGVPRSSSGHCRELAITQMLDGNADVRAKTVAGVALSVEDIIAMLVARNIGLAPLNFQTDPETIRKQILLLPQVRRPFIVNVPRGRSGSWFAVIHGASPDGNRALVTDFSSGKDLEVASHQIVSTQVVDRNDSVGQPLQSNYQDWQERERMKSLDNDVIDLAAFNVPYNPAA